MILEDFFSSFFSFFFSEYDECSNPHEHGCEHECFNTLGGYSCQCRIGYELHSDEKRCESKCQCCQLVLNWFHETFFKEDTAQ